MAAAMLRSGFRCCCSEAATPAELSVGQRQDRHLWRVTCEVTHGVAQGSAPPPHAAVSQRIWATLPGGGVVCKGSPARWLQGPHTGLSHCGQSREVKDLSPSDVTQRGRL